MQQLVIAFAMMVFSAFIAIYIGQRAGQSKTTVYALGLATMLVQIVMVTAITS